MHTGKCSNPEPTPEGLFVIVFINDCIFSSTHFQSEPALVADTYTPAIRKGHWQVFTFEVKTGWRSVFELQAEHSL